MTDLHIRHLNANTTMPLVIPVDMLVNTPTNVLFEHIKTNSLGVHTWVKMLPPNDDEAIICGSGPSLKDSLEDIKKHKGKIFALNAATKFLNENGIIPDYQVMIDAKAESLSLLGEAKEYLFGSTVDPRAFTLRPEASLFQLQVDDDDLQEFIDQTAPDDYSMVTTAVSVGVVCPVLAFILGYRKLHLYGVDSSHKDNASHVVRQEMNDAVACMNVDYCGKQYVSSLPMKLQAERLMQVADLLKKNGCTIEVHGSGLFPDMYNAPYEDLSEKEKYTRMWSMVSYRAHSPAERLVNVILEYLKPSGRVLDFGCGTGRASAEIAKRGHDVTLIDFAPNCRDQEAAELPFVELDLCEAIPIRGDCGYCIDVMEHIPPDDVATAIYNIMEAAPRVFFQISTAPDKHGVTIGHQLHLTVQPHAWWKALFEQLGYQIEWEQETTDAALFVIRRADA